MNKPEIITTSDGSHSLLLKDLNETYHSVHGAIQESRHVFINSGLHCALQNHDKDTPLNILEVGMGTGLNVLLTFLETTHSGTKINYTTTEPHPLPFELISQLNYPQLLGHNCLPVLEKIHAEKAGIPIELSEHFVFCKKQTPVQHVAMNPATHLVYFDAFAPNKQPELWTEQVFRKLFDTMSTNGLLVTYCAKGEVKRTLKQVGFRVETLPGPPGKREMVRVKKF